MTVPKQITEGTRATPYAAQRGEKMVLVRGKEPPQNYRRGARWLLTALGSMRESAEWACLLSRVRRASRPTITRPARPAPCRPGWPFGLARESGVSVRVRDTLREAGLANQLGAFIKRAVVLPGATS